MAPEISWGGVFFFYLAPDGRVPAGQPFATIITKDYPAEPSARLDRPGSFRVNIAASRTGQQVAPFAAVDPSTRDQVMPHPAYANLGWVAVRHQPGRADPRSGLGPAADRTPGRLSPLTLPPRQRPPLSG